MRSASLSPYGHPRAAVPQYGRDITWRNDHEKTQYAWDRRWCRVIGCGAPLASKVARDCGATVNAVTRHVRRVYRRAYRRAYYGYPYSYGGYYPYSYGGGGYYPYSYGGYYRPSYFGRWGY